MCLYHHKWSAQYVRTLSKQPNRGKFRSGKTPADPLVPRPVSDRVDCLEGAIMDPQTAVHAARARPFLFSELDDLFFGNNLGDLPSTSRSP